MSNNFLQNMGMQMPMFTGANQQSNDDVDLHDIFADYLAETDLAPQFDQQTQQQQQQFTNLQTAQQQQFELAANAVAAEFQAQQQQQLSLPTGGIKTSWHSGGLPNMHQGGGDGQAEPQPKRSRGEDLYLPTGQQQHQVQQQQQQQNNGFNMGAIGGGVTQQQLALAQAASGVGGLSNRLGFTLPNMNNNSGTVDISNLIGQQQNQQGAVNSSTQQTTLPIGMGLKFGAGGQVIMTDSMNVNNNMNNASANGASALATSQQARLMNQQQPNIAVSNMKYTTPSNTISQLGMSKKEIEAQMAEERRLRNREHAKRSRVRKKFMLESLQQQVRGLQDENSTLRQLVQTHIPQSALQIIDECCSKSVLFGTDNDGGGAGAVPQDPAKETPLLKSDFSLIESLTAGQQNFVLSDPRLPDNPIVFASAGFYEMTGYTRDQVLGRNCRFLQGAGTDRKAIDVIRTAVANGTDATVCLLNYKADGTPFWNQLFIAALRDADNCIVNYVGVQTSIEPKAGASALEEKVDQAHPITVGKDTDNNFKQE